MFLIPDDWYHVKKIGHKGRGVFAAHDIPAYTVIGDYSGKIVRSSDENELRDGLYTMSGGERYDILASPKEKGVHLINHSCANNCDIYPYRAHMLFVATRKIFAGEEICINYMLGKADKTEKNIPCLLHACHCGSKICSGSLHDNEKNFDAWENLVEHESGKWNKKMPGRYGENFPALDSYPTSISLDKQKYYSYNAFGSEKKPAEALRDAQLPPLATLRAAIRESGRQLSLPKLRMTIYGIQNDMILAERK